MPVPMRFLLTLALFLLTFESAAFACKCAGHSVSDALAEATAVFEGHVVSIEDFSEGSEPVVAKKKVTLSVVRVWKDLEDTETVSVTTHAESAACGFHFERGESYLVYAQRADAGFTVHSCSRTRPMADASEDLAQLGGGVTPVRITKAAPADAGAPRAQTTKPPKKGGCAVSGAPANRTGIFGLAFVALASQLARRRLRARARRATPPSLTRS